MSITDANAEVLKHIYDAGERSHYAIRVFCDLSKAFNCVANETLFLKLYYYGIQDAAFDLVAS